MTVDQSGMKIFTIYFIRGDIFKIEGHSVSDAIDTCYQLHRRTVSWDIWKVVDDSGIPRSV